MREIKFRGKRVDNGEWVYGYYARDMDYTGPKEFKYTDCIISTKKDNAEGMWYKVDPAIVGQFTGKHAVDGKEIYQDDILERPDGRRCQVIWWDTPAFAGWDLMALNAKGGPPREFSLWRDWVVIGNIHDNPELLPCSA